MSRLAAIVLTLLLMAVAGCANPMHYYRLEEHGQGWKLEVKEGGDTFLAKWVKGDNRSVKLLNYHQAPAGGYYVINVLFLEVDSQGEVVNGWLKRWATPEFSRRAYFEGRAEWFRVLGGTCVLDAGGTGEVDVRCEGKYEFKGSVLADENVLVKKSE